MRDKVLFWVPLWAVLNLISCDYNSPNKRNERNNLVQFDSTNESYITTQIEDDSDESFKIDSTYTTVIENDRLSDSIVDELIKENIDSRDSVLFRQLTSLNIKEVLLDTSGFFVDSLGAKHEYSFPTGNQENYFNQLKIHVSPTLSLHFMYMDELRNMSRYYSNGNEPSLEKVKKERITRIDTKYQEKLIFSAKYNYIEDNLLIITSKPFK